MYEKFYGLSGKPFQLNPDPKFFFRSTGHKRAMAYLRYGLQQGQGFIAVSGDVGTGKTMLVKNLFKEIEGEDYVAARIVSTNIKDLDLLRLLAAEFDLEFEDQSKGALLKRLETFFRASVNAGKRVLLVIDEAQNLPRSAIEELRMLSNFEEDGTPLVQSFLLGQREFRQVLRAPGLEQLRQRVIAAYHLKPLSASEVKSYIQHRLTRVNWKNDPQIEELVYHGVYVATNGVPRRINTLLDRLLLNCYLDESHEITVRLLESVRAEIETEQGDLDDDGDASAAAAQTPAQSSDAGTSAGSAPLLSDLPQRFQQVEQRLDQMQSLLETLSVKMSAAEGPQSQQASAKPALVEPGFAGPSDSSFPKWTTAFVSVLVVMAVVITAVGLKYFSG